METEIRKLLAMLARREGGRGRRFAPELRRQITAVGRVTCLGSSDQSILENSLSTLG